MEGHALKAEHLAGEGGGERRVGCLGGEVVQAGDRGVERIAAYIAQTARQAERLRLERDERTVRVRNSGQTAVADVEMLGHAVRAAAGCAVLDERDRLVGQGAGQQVAVFELEQLACGCGLRTDEPVCVDQKHRGSGCRRLPGERLESIGVNQCKKIIVHSFFLLRSVREFSICGSAQKFRSVRKLWMREERADAWAECGVCFLREERYNRAQSCICCLRRRRTLYGYSNYNMGKNKNRQKDTQTVKCFSGADAFFLWASVCGMLVILVTLWIIAGRRRAGR